MFRVRGLKILGRVGIHIFFFWKKTHIILCILKGILLLKCIKLYYFFLESLKKILGFTSKIRKGQVTLNWYFLFVLKADESSRRQKS